MPTLDIVPLGSFCKGNNLLKIVYLFKNSMKIITQYNLN